MAPHEAVVFHVLVDLALAAQARGVHDAVHLSLVLDQRVDGVARGAGHVGHDGAVVVGELVGERAFPRVRAADDGHVDGLDLLFRNDLYLPQLVHDLVQQVARAVAVLGAHRPRVAQAQCVKFPHFIHAGRVVHLVHGDEHRLARLLQDAGHLLVIGVDAGLAVHEEDDDVGLARPLEGLGADGALEGVVAAHLDAAGVDEHELDAVPVGLVVAAVTGDAAHLVHDGVAGLGDAVDQGGLAHVGAAHDGYDGKGHGYPRYSLRLVLGELDDLRQIIARVTGYHGHRGAGRVFDILHGHVIECHAVVVEDDARKEKELTGPSGGRRAVL